MNRAKDQEYEPSLPGSLRAAASPLPQNQIGHPITPDVRTFAAAMGRQSLIVATSVGKDGEAGSTGGRNIDFQVEGRAGNLFVVGVENRPSDLDHDLTL